MKSAVFLVEEFEEIEAVSVIDIMRRGNEDLDIVSLSGSRLVTGSHGIAVQADALFEDASIDSYDILILPGGGGYVHYLEHEPFIRALKKHAAQGKKIAAICAAPTVLGELGLLKGKRAVCFAGMEGLLDCAENPNEIVVEDGQFITSRSAATALFFGLKILESAAGAKASQEVADAMLAGLLRVK
ncbi:MAG: DJ-1/PfpI family protein [Clostridiales bacterium]|jgi:4-methyl-5(b-hydroxyethyl)-thiazole monophosphate biosynthesis|nr:DJ-1/PfpI family protein [Clostridiales bacterium]